MSFKAPPEFSKLQAIFWYIGLAILIVGSLTVVGVGIRMLVFVWNWVLAW